MDRGGSRPGVTSARQLVDHRSLMRALSHRGLWSVREEQNTPDAFRRSFGQGFGVELDVRDACGAVVISHDPPDGSELRWEEFLQLYLDAGAGLPVAVNVKADGIASTLAPTVSDSAFRELFFFDMSVPDMFSYLASDARVFARRSEFEGVSPLFDRVAGVWIDAFDDEWFNETDVVEALGQEWSVCLVSPELHGREPSSAWSRWSTWQGSVRERVMVCTDHPLEFTRRLA